MKFLQYNHQLSLAPLASVIAWLAIEFGKQVLGVAKTPAFEWGVAAFIFLCVVGSAFSIWRWTRRWHRQKE